MIRKLALAALLSLVPSPAVTTAPTGPAFFKAVKQVTCRTNGRVGKGTAFIAEHKIISVAHVTNIGNCSIDGMPITGIAEGKLDFSIIGESKERGFRIDCGGFKPGTYVFPVGYAKGWPWQTMLMLLATYQKDDESRQVLLGDPTVIPGMSGGPILNERGEVVGVVNAYVAGMPFSFSLPLSETSICKDRNA